MRQRLGGEKKGKAALEKASQSWLETETRHENGRVENDDYKV